MVWGSWESEEEAYVAFTLFDLKTIQKESTTHVDWGYTKKH